MTSARSKMLREFARLSTLPGAPNDPRPLMDHWASKEFLERLDGVRWLEILSSAEMQVICNDPAIWVEFMPLNWFPYYLPAMITVAYSEDDVFASNLRGLLEGLLAQKPNSRAWGKAVRDYLREALTESQRRAVAAYVGRAFLH